MFEASLCVIMENEDETKITNRIAIIALLGAIVFGTMSVYGNQKFDITSYSGDTKLILSVISQSLVIPLLIFMIYIFGLAMDYRYDFKKSKGWYAPFYDLGVALSSLIAIYTVIVVIVLKLAIYFNSTEIGVYGIYLGLIAMAIVFYRDLARPIAQIAYIVVNTIIQTIKKISSKIKVN